MDISTFCARYPSLMHMADAGAWSSICEHGILSTEAIADHLRLGTHDRVALLSVHRKLPVRFSGITVRDQRPINVMLAGVLDDGTTQTQWLELLNSKVFLWTRRDYITKNDRLNRFLSTYSEHPQLVLEFNSRRFLNRYASTATLCHINSGATRSVNHRRGRYSFVPFADYEWSPQNEVAEVSVHNKIEGILDLLDSASVVHAGKEESIVFRRDEEVSKQLSANASPTRRRL